MSSKLLNKKLVVGRRSWAACFALACVPLLGVGFGQLTNGSQVSQIGPRKTLAQFGKLGQFSGLKQEQRVTQESATSNPNSPETKAESQVGPLEDKSQQAKQESAEESKEQSQDPVERLRGLSAEERDLLRQKRDRFQGLSESEQQRLRELHRQLESHPESDRLRQVMLRYDEWLRSLPPVQRAEILDMPTTERIKRIKLIREAEARRALGFFGETKLPAEDVPLLYDWIDGFIRLHESAILDRLSERRKRELAKTSDEDRRRRRIAYSITKLPVEDLRALVTEDDAKSLFSCLSDEARRIILSRSSDEERTVLVQRWIRFALIARNPPRVTQEQLDSFFREQLTDKERDQLDRMPPEQRQKQLIWMYFSRQNSSRSQAAVKQDSDCCSRLNEEWFEDLWLG